MFINNLYDSCKSHKCYDYVYFDLSPLLEDKQRVSVGDLVDGENTPILYLQNTVNILDLEGKTTLHEHILPHN